MADTDVNCSIKRNKAIEHIPRMVAVPILGAFLYAMAMSLSVTMIPNLLTGKELTPSHWESISAFSILITTIGTLTVAIVGLVHSILTVPKMIRFEGDHFHMARILFREVVIPKSSVQNIVVEFPAKGLRYHKDMCRIKLCIAPAGAMSFPHVTMFVAGDLCRSIPAFFKDQANTGGYRQNAT